MTKEEVIEFGNMWLQMNEDCKDSNTYVFFQMAIKALEQKSILDKVKQAREEIKAESYREHIDGADCDDILIVELRDVLEILDKLIESEE